MADIKIRGIPDWVLEREKQLAKAQGLSLNVRLRGLIENDVRQTQIDTVANVRRLREETIQKHGMLPEGTIVSMIREDRDSRG